MQIYRDDLLNKSFEPTAVRCLFLCPIMAVVLSFLLLYDSGQKLHFHIFCNSNRSSVIVPPALP